MKNEQYLAFKKKVEQIRFKNPEDQKTLCLSFLEEAKSGMDAYGMFLANTYLLDYYLAIRDIENCQNCIYEGLAYKANENLDDVSQFYLLCGIYYFMSGDTHTSITYYCNALAICEEQKNNERKAGILNNLALIFYRYDDYEDALLYYCEAYELMTTYTTHYTKRNVSIVLGNMISCYQEIGDVKQALTYYKKLNEHDIYKALRMCLEANISFLSNDFDRAITYCKETYNALDEEFLDQHLVYTIHEDITKLMLKIGNKELTYDAIVRFYNISNKKSTTENLIVLRYYIQYAKKYEISDELEKMYKKYYILNELNEKMKKQAHITSYRDQILLDKMIRLNEGLKTSATYDSVTGLKSRNAFEHDIKQHLNNHKITVLSLMMCDVDNFKKHNDLHGHLFGDDILHHVGAILNQYANEDFITYRYGGDEFLCLGINKNKAQMEEHIRRIYKSIKAHPDINLSCGFTCQTTATMKSYIDLIDKADKALYRAKSNGKDQYQFNV